MILKIFLYYLIIKQDGVTFFRACINIIKKECGKSNTLFRDTVSLGIEPNSENIIQYLF